MFDLGVESSDTLSTLDCAGRYSKPSSQGNIQWCPVGEPLDHMITGFSFGTKRKQYQKRKFLLDGTLKIVYQIYHSKQEKQKSKSKFFYRDDFVLPEC